MHTKRIVASACLRCAVPPQIFVRPKHTKLFVAEASCRSDLQARVSRLAMVKKKKSWSNCTLGDWKLCSETLACGSRLYLSLEHFDYLWSVISIIALTRTERFLAFWLVDKTTDHGNDVMVADSRASRVLLGGSRFNLSFEHFDDISIWVDMSQYRPWKIVVDLLNRQWENVMYLSRSLLALEVPHHMSLSYAAVRSRRGGLVAGDWYATVLSREDLWWVRPKNGTNHDQCVDEIGERTSYEHD